VKTGYKAGAVVSFYVGVVTSLYCGGSEHRAASDFFGNLARSCVEKQTVCEVADAVTELLKVPSLTGTCAKVSDVMTVAKTMATEVVRNATGIELIEPEAEPPQ
jgi:hypothetical protein